MFRMFVPACGNQETTVITPLLGTGNQVKANLYSCAFHIHLQNLPVMTFKENAMATRKGTKRQMEI